MDGWMDGLMHGRMDGWDGWLGGWMDEWMDWIVFYWVGLNWIEFALDCRLGWI